VPARVLIHGGPGVGKAMLVRALAHEAGLPVVRVDVGELLRAPERLDERMARVAREAGLRGALTLFHGAAALAELGPGLAERFAELVRRTPGPVVMSAHARPAWLTPAIPELVEVELPAPNLRERIELWHRSLARIGGAALVSEEVVRAIAARFALGGASIRRAAERAVSQARLREDDQIDLPALGESARLMLQHRLGTVARRIEPGFAWADLVLPEDTLDTIKELTNFAKYRAALLEEWGFDQEAALRPRRVGDPRRPARHRQDDGGAALVARARLRPLPDRALAGGQQVHRRDREEPGPLVRRGRELPRRPVLRRGRRAVRQAHRGQELQRSLRQPRGQLPAAADGDLQRRDAAGDQPRAGHRRGVQAPRALHDPVRDARAAGAHERCGRACSRVESKVAPDVDWDRLGARFEMSGGYIKKAALRAAARAMHRGADATITGADLDLAAQLEYREMGRIG
jgi:hypothetical protein